MNIVITVTCIILMGCSQQDYQEEAEVESLWQTINMNQESIHEVVVDGVKYHFCFSNGDYWWSEERMHKVYDRMARKQDQLTIPELDGGNERWENGFSVAAAQSDTMIWIDEERTLENVINDSDVILLATYRRMLNNLTAYDGADIYFGQYSVDEVLKGEWEDTIYCERWHLYAPPYGYYKEHDGKVYIDYFGEYQNYHEGEQYLLCLKQNATGSYFSIYDSAIVDAGNLYPIKNTEKSVFYHVALDTIKGMC